MQIKKFFFYFHIHIHCIQKKYLPLHRNFRNKIYLYEIQNCLFDCAACFDELLCDTLWLLNNITNVNVFKKAEQKRRKK